MGARNSPRLASSATVAVAVAMCATCALCAACSMFTPSEVPRERVELAGGLVIQDLVIPPTEPVALGDEIEVHYACLLDGVGEVDSSYARGQALWFRLGTGAVAAGFEQGIVGMRPGGKRRIFVPPELAFGSQGVPGLIPPNAPLVFEVELISVKR